MNKIALSLAVLAALAAPTAVQAKSVAEHNADILAKRAEVVAKWNNAFHVKKPMVQKGKSSVVARDHGFKLVLCDRAHGKKYLLDCEWK